LEFGDEPDLIVRTTNGLLGIEHTRVFRTDHANGIVRQKQESLEQRIVDQAKNTYAYNAGPSLYVTLAFVSKIALAKNEVSTISAQVSNIVSRHIPNEGQHLVLDACKLPADYLPRQISAIFIDRLKNQREMFWAVMRSDNIPNLSSAQVQEIIRNKDVHLQKYRARCSEVWLLIVQDGFTPSSGFDIPEEVLGKAYKSGFERLFLFKSFECETHELNVER
jgi:hypothetical protein